MLLAVDWTEWHHGRRLLVVAMVTGKRAIPVFVQGRRKSIRDRLQNTRENISAQRRSRPRNLRN